MTCKVIVFVRTGNPNGSGLPVWPTVEQAPEQVMEFGEGSAPAPRPRSDALDFWTDCDGLIP
ncbi:hypothetical protein ACJ6WF_42815 [Streptomyces sp. MMS24-I2-30]|uniref:hypothetical protein n=1 Tax=unclassified Streptomyces TaxID=2593676 RepID=UPI0036D0E4E4